MALKYSGCSNFRARLTVSTLSGKALRLNNIRTSPVDSSNAAVGLQDFEASFLRLLDELSDGCVIEVNETGTKLNYRPGILLGGTITHDCGTSRSIGWFLEGIIPLLPFCKEPVKLTLTGITNDCFDFSVDAIRHITIPLLNKFGVNNANIVIKRRGSPPKGGGIIEFSCPVVRSLQSLCMMNSGKVRRVRGIVYCSKISPTIITRVIDCSKSVLSVVIKDVFLQSDHYRGADGGHSPGYSAFLMAETTTGVSLGVERTAGTGQAVLLGSMATVKNNSSTAQTNMTMTSGGGELPETVGEQAAVLLLQEMCLGGTVDRNHQPLVLLLMALGPEDVCKVRFGRQLTSSAVDALRLLRDAFGVVFKVKVDESDDTEDLQDPEEPVDEGDDDQGIVTTTGEDVGSAQQSIGLLSARKRTDERGTIVVSCLGIGYINMSRKIK